MFLKWIPEIPKHILAVPWTQKPLLGPQREKGKIKISVQPNRLLLKLRSSSHC